MREVGDGFSEEGTEVRTQDKEKLVTWCAGETAAAPAVHDLTTGDTIWARLGLEAGCWQRAGVEARGQRSFRLQEGVCILYDENPLKELKQKNQAALFGSRGGWLGGKTAWEWGPTSIHDSRSESGRGRTWAQTPALPA